jgi:hypothetical protein
MPETIPTTKILSGIPSGRCIPQPMENAIMSAQIVNLTADPIFGIIRKYKAAVAAFNAYDGPDYKKLEPAIIEAQEDFLRSVPATPEGFRMKVDVYLDVFCSGAHEDDRDFLDTLCKSACAIAGAAVQS